MAEYTVCLTIGIAFQMDGDSPEEVENFIREEMPQHQFEEMIIQALRTDADIEVEVFDDPEEADGWECSGGV